VGQKNATPHTATQQIPFVPKDTPMFNGDMSAVGTMARTWILFFQQLATAPDTPTQYDKATFGLAIGGALTVGQNVCPLYLVQWAGTIVQATAQWKTPSAGNAAHIDILRTRPAAGTSPASTVSIFGATIGGTPLVMPPAVTAEQTVTTFANPAVQPGDYLTVNVLQVGATAAGGDLVIVLQIELT